jgi:hypothetical protein
MSGREYRTITGERDDLTRVRDAASVRRVEIRGAGIKSIRGIERMQRLDVVTLARLPAPDLSLLSAVPNLETLTLTDLRGEVDWSALGALRNLASLAITVSAREHMGTTSASIRTMGLLGVEITDGLVDALRRLKTLRVAELELASLEQVRRLAAAGVNVMAAVGDSDETLGVVHRDPSSGRYSLGLNLAGAFDVETNLEAEGTSE